MNQKRHSKILSLLVLFIISVLCHYGIPVGHATPSEVTPGELLIRLTPEASVASGDSIAALSEKHGVTYMNSVFPASSAPLKHNARLQRTYLLRFSAAADLSVLKATFEASDLVEAVAYNYLRPTLASDEIVPDDPKYPEQWSLPLIKLPQAWGIEKGNRDVIIAIIDSGIDYKHEDLASKIWTNPGEIPDNGLDDDGNGYVDDMHGWDFTDAPNLQAVGDFTERDNEPLDSSGHGTHVAGIAGAMPDNGIGIAGVAWNCPLMAVRSGLSLGGGSRMQDDDSAAAIVYAADNGASVINMSWGSEQRSFVIQDAIDYAYARGVVLVGAAGNSQKAASIFPAGYRKVIAVASTEQHQRRFYQSNYGASIDIGAPGNAILSTQIDNSYRILTGTSMAAPHVAGVAALLRSKRPTLTHEEIRQILVRTADAVLLADSDAPEPKFVGAGTLNAERALLTSGALQARILAPETNSGGANAITIVGTAGGYKFASWQLAYGSTTVPTEFIPFTGIMTTQKVSEHLAVWDTTTVPEGIYTVRLLVTATDGSQTHDQVVLAVDRTPPQVFALDAIETLYGAESITIFTWATDDVTRNTLYYRRKGQITPFAHFEENEFGKEHLFSFGNLETGTYQFFIEAQNTVGLKTTDDNHGQLYTYNVTGHPISPNGFTEVPLDLPSLHIVSLTTDFDRDGKPEIVGTPLSETDTTDKFSIPHILEIYERTSTGKYKLEHALSNVETVANPDIISNRGVDLETFTPWAVDDTDNDGLLEILASDKERTFLIESLAPGKYPEQIIMESLYITGGNIADLDGDGRKEIVGADNNNGRLLIFETRGDNLYAETAELINETEGANIFAKQFAIADFDGDDGTPELVAGDSEGELFIYAATANDNFQLQWQTQLDIRDITQFATGDLTGDGTPELVVGGNTASPDVPSAPSIWKFLIFTYTPAGYTLLSEHAIAPYRHDGNSLAIAELDGDAHNELVIITYPNLYVMKWNGTTFLPVWHREVSETPMLLTTDLNNNGFDELYVNLDSDGVHRVESIYATDRNSIEPLTPWNVAATPLTAKTVQITWTTAQTATLTESGGPPVFTLYRATGGKDEAPAASAFEVLVENLTGTRFLDRTVTPNNTYWYTLTAEVEAGKETSRTEAVSVTPREPAKLTSATYHPPNWVTVTFDRPMGVSIADATRYLLREPKRIDGVRPTSAIRGRMSTHAILTFDTASMQRLKIGAANGYELTVSSVYDADENPLRTATLPLEIPLKHGETAVTDFTQVRVYPNPVYPTQADKGVITFDNVPVGTRIQLLAPDGSPLENLEVTESDGNRKQWWLTSNRTADVSTGVYIYILEFDTLKQIGKIAVIK